MPSMREHADRLEQQLEHHPPNQAAVTLHLTNDVFPRSFTWTRWQREIAAETPTPVAPVSAAELTFAPPPSPEPGLVLAVLVVTARLAGSS